MPNPSPQTEPNQLRKVSDRELATVLNSKSRQPELTEAERRNRDHAAEDLAHIFALRDSTAFDWYLKNGLDKKIEEADRELKAGGDDLAVKLAKWKVLAELRDWLTGLEITHRRKLDSSDPEIRRLTETLLLP